MARLLVCLPAVQILLVQGLPLDTYSKAGDVTAPQTVTYGLPQQYASKTSPWLNGAPRSTHCPHGTYTGGSCDLRDTDEPTSSTLYQPEAPVPATPLTTGTSYANGTRSEDCTTSEDPTSDSTHAPLASYSNALETRTEVIRTIYPQQSSESTPSLPQFPSSTASHESQGQYTFSSVDTTFSDAIISTTRSTVPTNLTSASRVSFGIRTVTDTHYPTALATITAYRTRSYGLPITIWTGLSSLHSHHGARTSEVNPHPTGYGAGVSETRLYPHSNSDTTTWSFSRSTTVDADPTQTLDPSIQTIAYFPTSDGQPTSSYFYGQPLPSASSSFIHGGSSRYPDASWSQSTQSRRGMYPSAGNSNTVSLEPIFTRSEAFEVFSSRQTIYPDPSASSTVIRDPIVTESEVSYTTWSQRTVYSDPSYSLTASAEPSASRTEIPWSTQTNYPDTTNSNTAYLTPTLTRSDFFDPTRSRYTIYPLPSSSDTFVWGPAATQTESWSRHPVHSDSSSSDDFTRDPTATQTESWSRFTTFPEPSSSVTLHINPTGTKSTSWIYPTAYWQPTSARSDLPTATPVQDPSTADTTFVTVTRTAFPGTDSLPSDITHHYHAANEWRSGFWHRLERLFNGQRSHKGEAWGEHEEEDGAGEFGRS